MITALTLAFSILAAFTGCWNTFCLHRLVDRMQQTGKRQPRIAAGRRTQMYSGLQRHTTAPAKPSAPPGTEPSNDNQA